MVARNRRQSRTAPSQQIETPRRTPGLSSNRHTAGCRGCIRPATHIHSSAGSPIPLLEALSTYGVLAKVDGVLLLHTPKLVRSPLLTPLTCIVSTNYSSVIGYWAVHYGWRLCSQDGHLKYPTHPLMWLIAAVVTVFGPCL